MFRRAKGKIDVVFVTKRLSDSTTSSSSSGKVATRGSLMNTPVALKQIESRLKLHAALSAALLCILLPPASFAGGADVSTDEIYSDSVTVLTEDGQPLDIDGDGNADLAVASNRAGAVQSSRYYLGNGDGTFSQTPVLLTDGRSAVIIGTDLNGDGRIDLVQARRDLTDIFYLGDGAGGIGAGIELAAGDTNRSLSIAVGDLDGDGDLDLVVGNGSAGGGTTSPQVNRFYLNQFVETGTVSFIAGDIAADADITRSIALADIDGDGKLDVIVGNDQFTPDSNRIYLNQFAAGSVPVGFAAGFDFGPTTDLTTHILIGDLNNNGKPDIVVVNAASGPSSGVNRFFLNNSTSGIINLSAATDVSADADRSNGGVLADFNGDGYLDLAVANFLANDPSQTSRNRLYLNQFPVTGTVSFGPGLDISTDEYESHDLGAVDLNGDGLLDIVVGNRDLSRVSGRDRRYLNNGNPDDPFANVVPVIDAQVTGLETDEITDLTIVIDDVAVTDPDNVFPVDFTLTVQAGTNYAVTDNTITPEAGFVGLLTVPVIVNDGTDDSAAFDLTVKVGNTPPSFTSTAVVDATEGEVYSYAITASDADGDPLTITATPATTLPAWLTLVDNGDGTATLSGTPAAGDVGNHDVSLEVSDGTDSATQEFTIAVEAAAAPPPPPPPPPAPPPRRGGGGSFELFSLLALVGFGLLARRRRLT